MVKLTCDGCNREIEIKAAITLGLTRSGQTALYIALLPTADDIESVENAEKKGEVLSACSDLCRKIIEKRYPVLAAASRAAESPLPETEKKIRDN